MGLAERIDKFLVVKIRLLLVLGGAALVIYGCSLLGYQVVFWLQWQQWQGCTILDLWLPAYSVDGPITWMPTFTGASDWVASPKGWFGLHSIVTWILGHIPFGIICVGFGSVFVINSDRIKTVFE